MDGTLFVARAQDQFFRRPRSILLGSSSEHSTRPSSSAVRYFCSPCSIWEGQRFHERYAIHDLRVDGVLGSWASFVSKMLHSLVPYRAEFLYTDVQSRGFVPWSVHKN